MQIMDLEKSSPELQGIASKAISAFIDEANQTIHDLHSLILLRHGKVVAEGYWSPFEPNDPHILNSLSKSFTSTAVGFAVAEGKLKVTDPVISFFPESLPPVISANLAAMQVRHLLSMATGHADDTMQTLLPDKSIKNWAQAILLFPVEYEPGTFFLYNTGASYLLSAIVQKVTGQNLLEYLKPRLFEPLGIKNPNWETNAEGIAIGGFGLGITTADIARFGQLYLQQGVWEGKQILPQEWVYQATTSQVASGYPRNSTGLGMDWKQGYGYQFWLCRYGAYRGDGAFGQFCLVMPHQQAVLAITAALVDMQPVLDLVWKHLMPAMKAEALPENLAAWQELTRKLAQLEIAPEKDQVTEGVPTRVSGKRYVMAANELEIKAISFNFDHPETGSILTIEDAFGTNPVTIGNGQWLKGVTTILKGLPRKVAASGGWVDSQTYLISLNFLTPELIKTPPALSSLRFPFGVTIRCRFVQEQLTLDVQAKVAFGENLPHKLSSVSG